MNRQAIVAFVVLGVVARVGPPAIAADSSLFQYLEIVTRRHPGLRAAEAKAQESESGRRESELERFPKLSARSAFTRGDHPVFVFGSLMEQGRFGPNNFAIDALNHPSDLTTIKSGLDLGVPLFTGFELTSAARERALAARAAQAEWKGLAQQVRLQAAATYLKALLARDLLKALDERLAASREEVNDAKRLKERGVVLGSDYFAALALFNGLNASRVELVNQERDALSRLRILAGQEISPVGQLSEVIPALPEERAWISQALGQRPDLAGSAFRVEQAEVGARQAGRTLWPRVEGFASLETNTNDFDSNPSNHLFGVAAKLPFGDPAYFARRSRIASSFGAAQESHHSAEEAASLELSEAYHGVQAALESLPIIKEMAANAEESLRLFRPLYRSGRQSILEVLRAEDALVKARAAYHHSLFRLQASYLQLLAASGDLNDQTLQDLSARLGGRG